MFEKWISQLTILFKSLLGGAGIADWALEVGIVLWLGILLFPLGKDTDRRDYLAASVYILFVVAAGVTLILAIPRLFLTRDDIQSLAATLFFLTFVTTMRWDPKIPVRMFQSKNPKEP